METIPQVLGDDDHVCYLGYGLGSIGPPWTPSSPTPFVCLTLHTNLIEKPIQITCVQVFYRCCKLWRIDVRTKIMIEETSCTAYCWNGSLLTNTTTRTADYVLFAKLSSAFAQLMKRTRSFWMSGSKKRGQRLGLAQGARLVFCFVTWIFPGRFVWHLFYELRIKLKEEFGFETNVYWC